MWRSLLNQTKSPTITLLLMHFYQSFQTSAPQAFHICWIIETCIKDTKAAFILGDTLEDECKSMKKTLYVSYAKHKQTVGQVERMIDVRVASA